MKKHNKLSERQREREYPSFCSLPLLMMLTPAAKQAATAGRGWAPKSPAAAAAAAACSIGFASGGS
jgi:hypothetical protein